MVHQEGNQRYRILGVVSASQVPDWERRLPKWSELVESVEQLAPGNSLAVHFENEGEAERARNAVRDFVNLKEKRIAIRTRIIPSEESGVDLYFVRISSDGK